MAGGWIWLGPPPPNLKMDKELSRFGKSWLPWVSFLGFHSPHTPDVTTHSPHTVIQCCNLPRSASGAFPLLTTTTTTKHHYHHMSWLHCCIAADSTCSRHGCCQQIDQLWWVGGWVIMMALFPSCFAFASPDQTTPDQTRPPGSLSAYLLLY